MFRWWTVQRAVSRQMVHDTNAADGAEIQTLQMVHDTNAADGA
jgi:hypothetical protein